MCVFLFCFWFILFFSFFLSFFHFSNTAPYSHIHIDICISIKHLFDNISCMFFFRNCDDEVFQHQYDCKSVSWVKIICQKLNEYEDRIFSRGIYQIAYSKQSQPFAERIFNHTQIHHSPWIFSKFHFKKMKLLHCSHSLTFSSFLLFFLSFDSSNYIVERHFHDFRNWSFSLSLSLFSNRTYDLVPISVVFLHRFHEVSSFPIHFLSLNIFS